MRNLYRPIYVAALFGILVLTAACNRVKDKIPQDVSAMSSPFVNLAGEWELQNSGERLAIREWAFTDRKCVREGVLSNLAFAPKCPAGILQCGSFDLSVGPYSLLQACHSPGVTVCTFNLTKMTPQELVLSCVDRAQRVDYRYKKM